MKKLIKLLSLSMAVMLFVACSSDTQAESIFTAGTYEGVAQGHMGEITVSVTVSDTTIETIGVVSHQESAGISDATIAELPAMIVENQSIAVDTIAGATNTGNGLIEAVKVALIEAGATEEQISKPVETTEVISTELIEDSADVVIIGSGGAGVSAAVEVLNAGGSVIILEKMPTYGGNTMLAGSSYNTYNPETQAAETLTDSEMDKIQAVLNFETDDELVLSWQETLQSEIDEYTANGETYLFDSPSLYKLQTYYGGDFVGNPELIEVLAENSLDGYYFLEEMGAEWTGEVNAGVGATWQRTHVPVLSEEAKGYAFVVPQVEYIEENGGKILLEHTAEEIIMQDGKAVGVKGVTADGQPFEIMGNKGVIIATGGFASNVEMRQEYNEYWENLDETVPTSNGPASTGDGIYMALDAGANLVDMEWIQMLPTAGGGVVTPFIQNQIYVNSEGNRIVAEDGRRDDLTNAILDAEGSQIIIISDSNTIKEGEILPLGGTVESRLANGDIYQADTLEDLANQLGIPYENLQATVEQFNRAVTEGNDEFGRQLFDTEIATAPFYAGYASPYVHHTMGGIEINTNAEVLDTNGEVIEGLYAAGEVTGGIHGANRLGGSAITDITVFGRIAGQNVMK